MSITGWIVLAAILLALVLWEHFYVIPAARADRARTYPQEVQAAPVEPTPEIGLKVHVSGIALEPLEPTLRPSPDGRPVTVPPQAQRIRTEVGEIWAWEDNGSLRGVPILDRD